MDKSCHSSGDSTITTNTSSSTSSSSRDHYLKHLNKISHKISKPIIRRPTIDHPNHHQYHHPPPQPQPQPQPQSQPQPQQQGLQQQQQQQHQPPVYNINKNDFRDVVQKLTGSPAHERFSTPPPIQPPKPQSSRLQRIRPPPLAHVSNRPPLVQVSNRPPHMLNSAVPPPPASTLNPNNPINNSVGTSAVPGCTFGNNGRQVSPLSPLPPFPAVHAAAESPISAYMRLFQTADSDPKRLPGFSPLAPLVSPRWTNPAPPPHQTGIPPPPTSTMTSNSSQFGMPSSPLPFGCLPSPRSPYPLLSPSLLFSPSAGQLGFPQFPLSPRLPVPSPRWRDIWAGKSLIHQTSSFQGLLLFGDFHTYLYIWVAVGVKRDLTPVN